MRRLTIKLPKDLDAALRARAARDGVSIANIVRTALTEYLRQPRPLSFAALGSSGQTDTAQRVEDILRQEWNTIRDP